MGCGIIFSAAQALPELAIAALHRLHDLGSDPRFSVEFGTRAKFGSCNVYVDAVGPRFVVSAQSGDKLQFLIGSLIKTPNEIAVSDRLYAFATQELGLRLGSDWRKQYPTLPAEVWVSKVDALIRVLDGVVCSLWLPSPNCCWGLRADRLEGLYLRLNHMADL